MTARWYRDPSRSTLQNWFTVGAEISFGEQKIRAARPKRTALIFAEIADYWYDTVCMIV